MIPAFFTIPWEPALQFQYTLEVEHIQAAGQLKIFAVHALYKAFALHVVYNV